MTEIKSFQDVYRIQTAAIERLEAENARLRGETEYEGGNSVYWYERLRREEKENARLREALQFYADKKHEDRTREWDEECQVYRVEKYSLEDGELARQALEKK